MRSHLGHAEVQDLEEDIAPAEPGPSRVFVEAYDYLELCTGPNAPFLIAMAKVRLRVGQNIEIAMSSLWDLTQLRVLEWVLVCARRFALQRLEPCAVPSVAH